MTAMDVVQAFDLVVGIGQMGNKDKMPPLGCEEDIGEYDCTELLKHN